MEPRDPRIDATVSGALQQTSAGAREAFIQRTCGADDTLQRYVREMLAGRESSAEDAALSPEIEAEFARLKPEESGDSIGQYKLLERLGEGGFGSVWMAEQAEPVQRRVALKIIKLGMDTCEVIARFEQERQALAVLDHPNIAKVFDAGATPFGRPFFVMELVRGEPISDYCRRHKLPTRERLALFIQVCRAIQHAHQKGIIHRDIKPSNMLVAVNDGKAVPKVIDFGIAKATGPRLTDKTIFTMAEQFIGTPAYMSPEQADPGALDIDTRTDIYSLGVVLYELLTGRCPFDGEELMRSGAEGMRRIVRDVDPPRPSKCLRSLEASELDTIARAHGVEPGKLLRHLRGDLDWVVMKALEKDRTRRYDAANALADDVQRYLDQQPVVARPPSTLYIMKRFAQRNRTAVAGASAVLVAILAGLVVSTALFFKEKAARAKADTAAVKSQQVATFLKQMLESVGPSKAKGRDAQMLRDILDNTAQRLGAELKDQPEVEAELRAMLGKTYEDLDEFRPAAEMRREQLRLARQVHGERHPAVAQALSDLGNALQNTDDEADAEKVLREALAMQRELFGSDDPKVAATIDSLAWARYRRRELNDALLLANEALAIWRKHPEGHEEEFAGTLGTVATILAPLARYAEGEATLREEAAVWRRIQGEMHPGLVTTLNNLCFQLIARGKLDEAAKLSVETLALGEKVFRKPLFNTTDSLMKAHALTLEFRGELAQAEERLLAAAKACTEVYGAAHGYTADGRAQLARVQIKLGKLDDAEKTLAAIPNKEADTDENPVLLATARLALARGDLASAERDVRAEVARQSVRDSLPTIDTARASQALANVLLAKGNAAAAEPLLREAIRIWTPANAGTPTMIDFQSDLADVLLALPDEPARAQEAESHLREVTAAYTARLVPGRWELAFARVRLAHALVATARERSLAEATTLLAEAWPALENNATIPLHEHSKIRARAAAISRSYDLAQQPDRAAEWRGRSSE